MIQIDQDMRDIVDSAKLSFAATICADGSPNLSPKGSLRVYDDQHLIFMDIDSPNTVENLRRDPRIEINVVDVFRRKGYRFKGTASFRPKGDPAYEWVNSWLLEINGPGYPANEVVLIEVERILPLLSPAYTYGGLEEGEVTEAWKQKYLGDVAPA